MNIGTLSCLVMALMFFLFALIFALLKERAAILISGFNTMPKEKREKYDKLGMSKDMRNLFFIYCTIFALGAVLSWLLTGYFAIPAFLIFFVIFFKNLHLSAEKAFEKYKL